MSASISKSDSAPSLTVRERQAHHVTRTLGAPKAGRGNPVSYGAIKSATCGRFFASAVSMADCVGILRDGRTHSPVFHPAQLRHPITVESDRGGYSSSYGVTPMAHATPPGAIRPKTTQTIPPADIRWVHEATAIKRVRRALTKQGLELFKPRQNRVPHIGEFAIVDHMHRILRTHLDLAALARELGVLAEDESVEGRENA